MSLAFGSNVFNARNTYDDDGKLYTNSLPLLERSKVAFSFGPAGSGPLNNLYDNNTTTYLTMQDGVEGGTGYVKWDLKEPRKISNILAYISQDQANVNTYLEGSYNDSDWTTIDTATGNVSENLIGTDTNYRYYRLRTVSTVAVTVKYYVVRIIE